MRSNFLHHHFLHKFQTIICLHRLEGSGWGRLRSGRWQAQIERHKNKGGGADERWSYHGKGDGAVGQILWLDREKGIVVWVWVSVLVFMFCLGTAPIYRRGLSIAWGQVALLYWWGTSGTRVRWRTTLLLLGGAPPLAAIQVVELVSTDASLTGQRTRPWRKVEIILILLQVSLKFWSVMRSLSPW